MELGVRQHNETDSRVVLVFTGFPAYCEPMGNDSLSLVVFRHKRLHAFNTGEAIDPTSKVGATRTTRRAKRDRLSIRTKARVQKKNVGGAGMPL